MMNDSAVIFVLMGSMRADDTSKDLTGLSYKCIIQASMESGAVIWLYSGIYVPLLAYKMFSDTWSGFCRSNPHIRVINETVTIGPKEMSLVQVVVLTS